MEKERDGAKEELEGFMTEVETGRAATQAALASAADATASARQLPTQAESVHTSRGLIVAGGRLYCDCTVTVWRRREAAEAAEASLTERLETATQQIATLKAAENDKTALISQLESANAKLSEESSEMLAKFPDEPNAMAWRMCPPWSAPTPGIYPLP
eukprot:6371070-Pyramimonas_sp.AAC.3